MKGYDGRSVGKDTVTVIFYIINNFENLYGIGSTEQEIAAAISYYKSLGKENKCINERFAIIGKMEECVGLFDKLNDTLTGSWDEVYLYAAEYYEKNGNLNVPKKYKTVLEYSLGT